MNAEGRKVGRRKWEAINPGITVKGRQLRTDLQDVAGYKQEWVKGNYTKPDPMFECGRFLHIFTKNLNKLPDIWSLENDDCDNYDRTMVIAAAWKYQKFKFTWLILWDHLLPPDLSQEAARDPPHSSSFINKIQDLRNLLCNNGGYRYLFFLSVLRIRIRIHMFLGLPNPDPSLIMQK